MTDRNLKGIFFKMSGYMPEEVDEMIYRQKIVKQTLKEQKERRQFEKRTVKIKKVFARKNLLLDRALLKIESEYIPRKLKPERLKEQIQRGYELAAKWTAEAKELKKCLED